MAEIPLGGSTADSEKSGTAQSVATMANWAGAAVSLALVVGIAVWGYKTLSRDVSGVPVVRAASGNPMRIEPLKPGGEPALNQGLAVNSVAAEGVASGPVDHVILAPAPVDLNADDGPTATAVVVAATPTGDGSGSREATAPRADLSGAPLSPQMASIKALAEQLASGSDPLAEVAEPAPEGKVATVATPAAPAVPSATIAKTAVKGGLTSSLRPVLRPASLSTQPKSAPAEARVDVAPADVPAGTSLAQLGAFESAEIARREWDKLNQQFAEYLEGKQRVIQRAQSGGRTFYRLRAMGFADVHDARRFCSALVAERADCIPVTAK